MANPITSALRSLLMPVARWALLERRARGRSLEELQERLHSAADTVADRMGAAADTPDNREQARHIIGIERWAQQRLRVAVGEPLVEEEYDAYRPDKDVDMPGLREAFVDARHNSLVLVSELREAGVDPRTKIPHNDFGPVTVGGWIAYLEGHADFESKRLKTG